jgi:hypothetical protein
MDLNELQQKIYRINKANGWFDGPPRAFGDDVALICEEALEAFREYRHNHETDEVYGECVQCGEVYTGIVRSDLPCSAWKEDSTCGGAIEPKGVPVELIDVIIRALDSLFRARVMNPDAIMRAKLAILEARSYRHGGRRI